MYPGHPLQQLLRRRDAGLQYAFAREARALLEDDADTLLEASHGGLRVYARNEDALAARVAVLREIYGEALEADAPEVRYRIGKHPLQPLMHVRVEMTLRDLEPVLRELRLRGVHIIERHARGTHCVLRGEAPLAALLGLPARLAELTAGRAQHWIALSRYAPVACRDARASAAV